MTRSRHRPLFSIVFALLLLGMQRELQVHALQHLRPLQHVAHEQGLQAPVADSACLECPLLVGGSSFVAVEFPPLPTPKVAPPRAVNPIASRSLAAPSYYSSRAPPPLL